MAHFQKKVSLGNERKMISTMELKNRACHGRCYVNKDATTTQAHRMFMLTHCQSLKKYLDEENFKSTQEKSKSIFKVIYRRKG